MALILLVTAGSSIPTRAQSPQARRIVRLNEGIVFFDRGEYARAERVFDALVTEHARDTAAQYYVALCRMQLAVRATEPADRRRLFASAAQALARVLSESPELVEARLDLGIAQLGQASREAAAADSLQLYVASDLGQFDAYGHFFLAVAQYRQKRYEEAITTLTRTEQLDETLTPYTNFYRGLVHTRMHRPDEARNLFAEVTRLAPGSALAQRAETLSHQVDQPAGGVFGGTLRIGADFDSNVVLLGDNTSLPPDLSSKEDFRFGVETDFSFSFSLPPETLEVGESLTIGLGGTTYTSWHAGIDEFDVQTYGGRVFINYEPVPDLFLGVQYDYDYNLVGRAPFLSRNRITPIVKWIEWRDGTADRPGSPRTWTTAFYAFEDRDYFDPISDARLDRDGSYHTVGVLQGINLVRPWPDDPRWLAARLGFRYHRARTQGDDFDLNANILSAGLDVPLPWNLTFDLAAEWAWEDYSRPSSIDRQRRERDDFVQRYLFGLTKQINANLSIRAEVNLIFDDSNVLDPRRQAPFSYDRAIWGFSVIYSF